jgi:adenylyltransferase/sulfurtransferase
MKPRLFPHLRLRFEPARDGDDDRMVFTCERRRIVLRGRSFSVFVDRVVPLLDGSLTVEELQQQLTGVVDASELESSLALLQEHGIVEDAMSHESLAEAERWLAPQVSYLREVGPEPSLALDRLARATVTVVGLGSIGAVAARALAATNIGALRLVDSGVVSPADVYLTPIYDLDEVGSARTAVMQRRLRAAAREIDVELVSSELATDADVAAAVAGSTFVLGCVDPGLSSLTYKLNRVCLEARIPWCSGTASAFEGVVGPTVVPYETACYLCYQMRSVACRDDPVDALAELQEQDRLKEDLSPQRENLAFGSSVVGNLLALETFRVLTGAEPVTAGRLLTFDFMSLTSRQHVILRKPWCPACFATE